MRDVRCPFHLFLVSCPALPGADQECKSVLDELEHRLARQKVRSRNSLPRPSAMSNEAS